MCHFHPKLNFKACSEKNLIMLCMYESPTFFLPPTDIFTRMGDFSIAEWLQLS